MNESEIQMMLGRDQIRDVLARLARGVDRADAELVASCYWPDSLDEHGPFRGTGREFADKPERHSADNVSAHHMLGQSLIEVEGDVATSETYFRYTSVQGRDDPVWVEVHGRYLDRLEKRDGAWKVRFRKVLLDASREEPYGKPFRDVPFYTAGDRHPADLCYAIDSLAQEGLPAPEETGRSC